MPSRRADSIVRKVIRRRRVHPKAGDVRSPVADRLKVVARSLKVAVRDFKQTVRHQGPDRNPAAAHQAVERGMLMLTGRQRNPTAIVKAGMNGIFQARPRAALAGVLGRGESSGW